MDKIMEKTHKALIDFTNKVNEINGQAIDALTTMDQEKRNQEFHRLRDSIWNLTQDLAALQKAVESDVATIPAPVAQFYEWSGRESVLPPPNPLTVVRRP
jgi:esterase/lipase